MKSFVNTAKAHININIFSCSIVNFFILATPFSRAIVLCLCVDLVSARFDFSFFFFLAAVIFMFLFFLFSFGCNSIVSGSHMD